MRAIALALVALLFVYASNSQPVVVTISSSAKFGRITPLNTNRYQYLYYVSNSAWSPANRRWDCSNLPDLCNRVSPFTCRASSSRGPACCYVNPALPEANDCFEPDIPDDSPLTLDLDTFPWQIRWGLPETNGVDNGVGIPSGFGFRGTNNQGLNNIYQLFWVGEAVHFNNVIKGGHQAGSWDFVISLSVTPAGTTTPQIQDFTYRLNLDETRNYCVGQGCPWSSTWWSANVGVDTRPECPIQEEPILPDPDDDDDDVIPCCRYFTNQGYPCADRVWTLDALDQTKIFTINNRPYTLHVRGFSLPNNPAVQKSYFISQEQGNTRAEIWAQLVDACPTQTCPPGSTLVVVGNSCVCNCTAPPCPAGQRTNGICACECDPAQWNCNGGTVQLNTGVCSCNCAAVTCPPGKQLVPGTNCSCGCPPNLCGTGTINPTTCACSCPPCPTGQVSNATCGCNCPTNAEAACAAVSGTWTASTCSCTVCNCPDTPCKTNGVCNAGNCVYDVRTTGACSVDGSALDACVAQCDANGDCIYDAVDCAFSGAAVDEQCNVVNCTVATGQCATYPLDNIECTRTIPADENAPCVRSWCRAGACVIEPVPVPGIPCVLPSGEDQCNAAVCQTGQCVISPKDGEVCTDNDGCTFLNDFTNPVTGLPSDGCVLAPGEQRATCEHDRNICDHIVIPCNTVVCEDTVAGAFCRVTPLPWNTACDDSTDCTEKDVCQQQLEADPVTGLLVWVPNGICEGTSVSCPTEDPCRVGRCLEGTQCTYRTDVRNDYICKTSESNCTIYRCDDGECKEAENICGGGQTNQAAIIGAAVGGAAALMAAAAAILYARNRMAKSKVFDPATWDQLQAGAGVNSPLYEPRSTEVTNQLYHTN